MNGPSGNFLVAERFTLADLHNFSYFRFSFQTSFDEKFRKEIPNLTAWFVRVSEVSQVRDRLGKITLC